MQILIVSEYYYPERFLITEIAERLVSDGHSVTVLTGLPNYGMPGGLVPKEYRLKSRQEEIINGVKVVRCSVLGRGKNKLRLFLNYFSYMRNATQIAKKLECNFDVVYCYQVTPIFQLHPAIHYCKKHNKKLVCYCLDLAPESGSGFVNKLPVLHQAYAKYAKWAYQQCDKIAVTSRAFIPYLNRVNDVREDAIVYLPQHASPELLNFDLTHKRADVAEFLFAGNIGNGPRLETIVYAAERLVKSGCLNFRVTFIGNGSAKERLMDIVKEKDIGTQVVFREGVPMNQMPEIYKEADVLLVTLRKGQITIPGKLQAYMATGKPIIGAMDGSGADLIKEAGCGMCASAEDVEQLADLMKKYIAESELFTDMGMRGREYFRSHFSLDTHMEGLMAILRNVQE